MAEFSGDVKGGGAFEISTGRCDIDVGTLLKEQFEDFRRVKRSVVERRGAVVHAQIDICTGCQ